MPFLVQLKAVFECVIILLPHMHFPKNGPAIKCNFSRVSCNECVSAISVSDGYCQVTKQRSTF